MTLFTAFSNLAFIELKLKFLSLKQFNTFLTLASAPFFSSTTRAGLLTHLPHLYTEPHSGIAALGTHQCWFRIGVLGNRVGRCKWSHRRGHGNCRHWDMAVIDTHQSEPHKWPLWTWKQYRCQRAGEHRLHRLREKMKKSFYVDWLWSCFDYPFISQQGSADVCYSKEDKSNNCTVQYIQNFFSWITARFC